MSREFESTTRLDRHPTSRSTLFAIWEGGSLSQDLPPRPVVIGRGTDADVVIDHPSLSRRHAVILPGATPMLEDLGSANGTRVRGQSLSPGVRAEIASGEPFELGSVVVIVRGLGGFSEASGVADEARPTAIEPPWEHLIDLSAPTEISVLLLGETGVGKGFYAKQIHDRSKRASGPWLHLNCAALPENLLESELFGYERGAFTGAHQAKPGLLESASGGTVFLDEMGEMPLGTQAKLLLAIERREVTRVGALKPRPFNVRFLSATNRNLEEHIENGAFRADLYYRLAGLPITIAPLRTRRHEIPKLALRFLEEASQRTGRPIPAISPSAMTALSSFEWPGNVRQLATVLERALLWCGDLLLPEHLMLGGPTIPPPRISQSSRTSSLPPTGGAVPPPPPSVPAPASQRSLREDVDAIERRRISEALDACGGNQVRAAELLGISRRTLINRMIAFGMPRPRKG